MRNQNPRTSELETVTSTKTPSPYGFRVTEPDAARERLKVLAPVWDVIEADINEQDDAA